MEMWKQIPGYEGLYEASNNGRIRTADGKTTANARYPIRVWEQRILKPKHPTAKKRQDLRVTLWKDGEKRDCLVSRLVASAWLGVPAAGMTVNHINGDWTDNRSDNLEWCSLADNIKHGFETGLFDSFQKNVTLVSESGWSNDFKSMASASRFLGRSNGYISIAVKLNRVVSSSITGERYTVVCE